LRLSLHIAWISALASLALPAVAVASEPPPSFEATFEFLRNDKVAGESTARYESADGRWTVRSDSHGTRGLARFLGLEERTESRGRWQQGALVPLQFEQVVKVAVKTVETRAQFDWEEGVVHSTHKDGEDRLPITPGTLDPGSVGLRIRLGLLAGEREWSIDLVDEDEIETQKFEALPAEKLDTALGCLDTIRVDRIRDPESTRYTQTWYAVDHAFAPVKVAHGKRDGDHMETRITTLTLDGKAVNRGAGC